MPAITVDNDEALGVMWRVHLDEKRAADDAERVAKEAERLGNDAQEKAAVFRQQATEALQNAERRARQILDEGNQEAAGLRASAAEKEAEAQGVLKQSAEARREENRHRNVAKAFAATVDQQVRVNSNLTHPMTREQQAADAFKADPLNAAYDPVPDPTMTPQDGVHVAGPRLVTELPGVLVAPMDPTPPQAVPVVPPSVEQNR